MGIYQHSTRLACYTALIARVIVLCVQSLEHNTCAMQYAYKYAICLQNPTFILLRNQNLAFGTYQIQAPHGGVENTHVHVFTELVAVAGYYVGRQTVDTNCDVAVFPGSTPQLTLHVFFPFLEQVVCSICSTVHTTWQFLLYILPLSKGHATLTHWVGRVYQAYSLITPSAAMFIYVQCDQDTVACNGVVWCFNLNTCMAPCNK